MRRSFTAPVLIALIAAAVLILVAVEIAATDPAYRISGALAGDAFYRGKPTRYWRLKFKEIAARGGKGADLLAEIPTRNPAPMLIECAADKDVVVRRAASLLLGCLSPTEATRRTQIDLLDDPDDRVRDLAISDLARQRLAAIAAVPKLLEIASNDSDTLNLNASHAIWSIDPDAAMKREGWKRFSSDEFGFSILFPGKVVHDTRETDGLHGTMTTHVFQVECDPEIYGVQVGEVVPEVLREIEAGDAWYEMMDQKFAEFSGSEIIVSRQVSLGSVAGHERISRTKPTSQRIGLEIANRIFVVGSRAYSPMVTYATDSVSFNPIAVEKFFESLELSDSDPASR